jgi:hypothetical protein
MATSTSATSEAAIPLSEREKAQELRCTKTTDGSVVLAAQKHRLRSLGLGTGMGALIERDSSRNLYAHYLVVLGKLHEIVSSVIWLLPSTDRLPDDLTACMHDRTVTKTKGPKYYLCNAHSMDAQRRLHVH